MKTDAIEREVLSDNDSIQDEEDRCVTSGVKSSGWTKSY
jgi:hypothetical protein